MVNNSPKNNARSNIVIPSVASTMVDALEDDLVKQYENERKEKEKGKSNNETKN